MYIIISYSIALFGFLGVTNPVHNGKVFTYIVILLYIYIMCNQVWYTSSNRN